MMKIDEFIEESGFRVKSGFVVGANENEVKKQTGFIHCILLDRYTKKLLGIYLEAEICTLDGVIHAS